MTGMPPPRYIFRMDHDETEGRLCRAKAEALARSQLAYEKRRVRLKSSQSGGETHG